jgi:hypothetical protein
MNSRIASILLCTTGALAGISSTAFAQVTVGYSSLTSVTGAAVVDQVYRQRTTDQYEITGFNVEPHDGGNVFNRNTIWRIYDQSQPWSHSVVDNNPSVEVGKDNTSTRLVQAGRKESVYSTISGPLYSTTQQQNLTPFAPIQLPAIVPISTSVFPDEAASSNTTTKTQ